MGLTLLGATAALVVTNPNLNDYEAYAGEQLVELASEEICGTGGLPMLMRILVKDCPGVISSQQPTLSALAGRFSSRLNLGLLSVFTTEIGGQTLLPGLRLPRYKIISVGIAGHVFTVHVQTDPATAAQGS